MMRLVLLGLFVGIPALAADPVPFRAVTYNLHYGQGLVQDAAGFGEFLSRDPRVAGFDVLGVEELCGNDGGKQVTELSALLSQTGPIYTQFVSSDVNDAKECGKGQGIFSRHPILSAGSVMLPHVRQPRVMVWVDLEIEGHPLRVYDLHLDSRAPNFLKSDPARLKQIQFALNLFLEYRQSHPGSDTLVMGDFNSWNHVVDVGTKEASIREMDKYFTPSTDHFEITQFPWQLDWIFSNGPTLLRSEVVHEGQYSDHYPLCADYLL
jgi:endonuclease/exonuclease/phosphatase family metal-dependent hydrolase